MRFPALGLAYLLLYAAGASLLGGQPRARSILGSIAIILPALTLAVVVLYRRRQWRGCQRLFWDSAAIGVGLWIVGYAAWVTEAIAFGPSGSLRWYTLVSLCGGIVPLIALLARPHLGVRSEAVTGVAILMASYALLGVFVYADFLLVPSLVLPQAETQSVLARLVQVNRAALAAGFLWVAWIGRRSAWRRVYLLLAAGVTIGFLLRFITSRGIFDGRYESGIFVDLAWIAPFLCYAWAASVAPPSSRNEEGGADSVPVLRPFWAAVPVLLIPVVGYLAWWLQPLEGNGDAFRTLLTALLTVAGLGFLILRLSLQAGELQRTDARLRLLAAATEQTQDLILITDGDGRVEHANEAFVRALGYSREALSRCSFADLLEHGFDRVDVHIRRDLRFQGVWRGTLFRRRRDGSTFPASCTITALRVNGAITHLVGVERDITEELRLQDQLVHTERLSAIGELVAGVAHEINNPLQTVVGSVELMLEDNPAPSTRRDLETVRREAGRAAQIVRSLLAFVRRGAPERVAVDLNGIVREAAALRAFSFQQKAIQLSIEPFTQPVLVLGSREELQQIVMNLLLNAEQAVGTTGSGVVTVRTGITGQFGTVEIEDNGPGVDEVLRGRIFEPFFTTKPVGEGTGLGLSISHGIASAHGGSLELLSVARGATFRLSVPVHERLATGNDVSSELVTRPAATEASALPFAVVVDDEPAIRELLARLLRKRSFDVVEAKSGGEAIEILRARDAALVLCDIRMPGMTGPELFERVATLPGARATRFIFMTGDREAAEQGVGGAEVLAKPFTGADLDRALEALSVVR